MKQKNLSQDALINKVNAYIDPIKKEAYKSVYMLSHPVLNKNPYTSDFHHNLFFNKKSPKISLLLKLNNIVSYYIKNILFFVFFVFAALLHTFLYRRTVRISSKNIVIDSFLLLDKVITQGKYQEAYFQNIEEILIKKGYRVVFMPRLYGHHKKIFALIKLFTLLQNDKRDFLFEYAYLTFFDYIKIIQFILLYPMHHFNIKQTEKTMEDRYFNNALHASLKNVTFESYVRYLLGVRLAQTHDNLKIFSWCEFQNMEKNFYKAINETTKNITVYGCQFLIQYKAYQSMFVDNLDKKLGISPTKVLTNGYYYNNQANQYNGVSLRYKGIYHFDISKRKPQQSLVLLSYDIHESRLMLENLQILNRPLHIKTHPAVSQKVFEDLMQPQWSFVKASIYELFYQTDLVFVAPMSGTALEAVALGIPVIVVANKASIAMHPLCERGEGKLWNIVFCKDELLKVYNTLLEYQQKEHDTVLELSQWYKNNFFIEPTEENIVKAFDLK